MMKVLMILMLAFGLVYSGSSFSREVMQIPDEGWRLWPDREAEWQNDSLYLPNEVNLDKLPVNPPSGGWEVLSDDRGIEVTLPTTVEQHFWGEFGFRKYEDEYYFEGGDEQVKNGNYLGVSWWWREINVPESFRGKQVQLYIRGARLRAEVYLNRQLVGYHIITETSFTCNVNKAIRPGEKNLLAIRITNPGGRMDWLDTRLISWGDYRFHASHGFGGLDRGLLLRAHDPIYIDDLWVLNTADLRQINARAKLINSSNRNLDGTIRLEILDPDMRSKVVSAFETPVTLPASGKKTIQQALTYENTIPWELESPKLYRLRATIIFNFGTTPSGPRLHWKDSREVDFGFRWFEADGLGENAVLRLNGKRIRLVSAISWGFWGLNGLWPIPELAEREVMAAKAFGMNCINFHRNIGKAEVLDAQDRLGLLRFMEPGGGQTAFGEEYTLYAESPDKKIDTSGKNGDPQTFAEKYMEEKIVRMVRDHRSHPSLLMYCIQNEIHPDLQNPRIFRVLRRIHREDPSRIVVVKSGIPPRNQAWLRPYEDTVYHDRGDGYSGWWDQHTVGGPGVWQDAMYKDPADFTHRSVNDSEIVVWGEMLGAAVPDNHAAMIREIKKHGGESYDLKDHREILAAYQNFLKRWDFHSAFDSAEDLFVDIGNKCYDFWGRVIETARLAEANDFLVISGWESTAIENHSGLLDNLRQFKGIPELLKKRLAPFRPVIKAHSLVLSKNDSLVCDLFLLNETGKSLGKEMQFSITDPEGKITELGRYQIPDFEADRFVYPITNDVSTKALSEPGKYRLRLSLVDNPNYFSEEQILVIDPIGEGQLPQKVGVLCDNKDFLAAVNSLPGLDAEMYQSEQEYDVAIVSDRLMYGWRSEVESTREIQGTEDDVLYHTESWGWKKNLEYTFYDLPPGKARVTLKFAEITLSKPGARIFDVAINGQTVLKDFDIYATAGGPNIAVDTAFTVDAPEGMVQITIPRRTVNYGKFSAIKVEAGDTTIAINCGAKQPYRDKNGLVWEVYRGRVYLNDELIERAKNGMNLLILPQGEDATLEYVNRFSKAGAFQSAGHVGKTRASWMGSWYFVREHPVFEGLPVDQALKSYYQVPVSSADGVLIEEGEGIEVFAGYGRDHDRNIGAASFTAPLGQGKILFHTFPGLISGMTGEQTGMHPVIAKRLMANSLRYLR